MTDAFEPGPPPPEPPDPTGYRPASGFASVLQALTGSRDSLSFWEILAMLAFLLGLVAVVFYSAPMTPGWGARFALLLTMDLAAWMAGSMLGFLFGVPRFKADASTKPVAGSSSAADSVAQFTPNTNLEQISDWLTKIIVGATLVQLGTIVQRFGALCAWIGHHLPQPTGEVFVGALMVFLFFAGFMWGYLWCSIRIFREMAHLTSKLQAV